MRKKNRISLGKKLLVLGCLSGAAMVLMFVHMFFNIVTAQDGEVQVFASSDGLMITADSYFAHDVASAPLVVMFHQGSWSRGEFLDIAPRFNRLGYNCLAVDLRAGNKIQGVENMTAARAQDLGKQTRFIDAMQDIVASLQYAKRKYNPPILLGLGSSYSAGLLLKVAGDNPGMVDGILAFSPAEYFTKEGTSYTWVTESAANITVPVFIASSRKEKNRWKGIFDAINTQSKISYIPATSGNHGSRALWSRFPDSENYWVVVELFLKNYFR